MYWMYCGDLRHEEGEQIYSQAMAYCDVHDIGTFSNCLLAERAGVFEKLGRWDECVSLTHAMLNEQSLSPSKPDEPLTYQAKVMARRGQDGYWPYLDEAMRFAIGLDEPEWLLFVRLARIEAYWLEGRLDAATSRAGSGRAMPRPAWLFRHSAGSPSGRGASPERRSQLILSHSPHRPPAMLHRRRTLGSAGLPLRSRAGIAGHQGGGPAPRVTGPAY